MGKFMCQIQVVMKYQLISYETTCVPWNNEETIIKHSFILV